MQAAAGAGLEDVPSAGLRAIGPTVTSCRLRPGLAAGCHAESPSSWVEDATDRPETEPGVRTIVERGETAAGHCQ